MNGNLEILRQQARVAAARGDYPAAITALMSAAAKTHASEAEYDAILRPLADVFARANEARKALTVVEVLASNNPSEWKSAETLMPAVTPVDRARALAAQGHTREAAQEAETGGWIASAAFLREDDGDWPAARALWARLAAKGGAAALGAPHDAGHAKTNGDGPDGPVGMYVSALVHFNLARCARQCQDGKQLREATVAAVRLLEEAADHFEGIGQRERAFDCFQVLAQVGRETGAFEDVLEGYVNSIRILREDHLKHYALQHYDEAIDAAAERGEAAAAATLAREGAEYARSLGLERSARRYVLRQAALWRASARRSLEQGAPSEIAENALLASVLAFGEAGQAARVGEVYAELAELELEPARREHYGHAAQRYASARDEPLDAARSAAQLEPNGPATTAPVQARHLNAVWRVDVLEWERGGSAAEACAELMLDSRMPEFMRRKAMLARLTALEAEARSGESGPEGEALRSRLAGDLGQVQLYPVLSPLEHLFAQASVRGERSLKIAVLEAIETLFFKRSFATLRAGLSDADPAVVGQAVKALGAFQFEHAFEPLSRLVRESANPDARAAAMRSLAHIDTADATELLLGVLEHGSGAERSVARDALRHAKGAKFNHRAREILSSARSASSRRSGGQVEFHADLRDILAARNS